VISAEATEKKRQLPGVDEFDARQITRLISIARATAGVPCGAAVRSSVLGGKQAVIETSRLDVWSPPATARTTHPESNRDNLDVQLGQTSCCPRCIVLNSLIRPGLLAIAGCFAPILPHGAVGTLDLAGERAAVA
jgi:hypothetical protein